MKLAEFNFDLPDELIAQYPTQKRDACKLLVLHKQTGKITHTTFTKVGSFLNPGDVLVLNNTKVFPARLLGQRSSDQKNFECLLIKPTKKNIWQALINPIKKITVGDKIIFKKNEHKIIGTVIEKNESIQVTIELSGDNLDAVGHIPLPPYIKRPDTDQDKSTYQTVYAKEQGSVAAPTAGLHFTQELLDNLTRQGIQIAEITLHVGYGTFKPIRNENIENHTVDPETYEIDAKNAQTINKALNEGRRVIAVGTTTVRCLESALVDGSVLPGPNQANIFIYPGFKFQAVSGMVTNFHLPKSSLLMLVSALAGRDQVLNSYKTAVQNHYRFYSYGDAMLII